MDPFWGLQMAYRWWEQVLWDVLAFSVRVHVCQSIHPKMAAILGPKDGTSDHGPRISMGSILGAPKMDPRGGTTDHGSGFHGRMIASIPQSRHIHRIQYTYRYITVRWQLVTMDRAQCDGSKG